MPVWHELTSAWRASGRLRVVGITQEQHPSRCRLFAQWQGIEWPILWDPFNLTGSEVVPRFLAIDEYGVVRSTRPNPATFEKDFLDVTFDPPAGGGGAAAGKEPAKDGGEKGARGLLETARTARGSTQRDACRAMESLLWSPGKGLDDAVDALERDAAANPGDPRRQFRLGVALRMREDSPAARPGDFQAAIDHWALALDGNPNQYIWRRRIQQYGPRLDKPYPFYDWVDAARAAVRGRGGNPVALRVPLTGSEKAAPARTFSAHEGDVSPDPEGKIRRDEAGWIGVESAVAFQTRGTSLTARVHVVFRPNPARKAHWNNEVGPMQVWIGTPRLPEGWKVESRLFEHAPPAEPLSRETRLFDFELKIPWGVEGEQELGGYALYYACEDVDGTCLYLRKDFTIRVRPPGD